MALTESQRQQMLAQTNQMLKTLAKISGPVMEAAKVFDEAKSLGISYDPKTTEHQDLAKQIAATKSKTDTPATIKAGNWYISRWDVNADGSWKTQPTLTINGKAYKFDTLKEYISKLDELKNAGVSGDIDRVLGEFRGVNSWVSKLDSSADAPVDDETPAEVAEKVGLPKSKINISGIDFELPNDLINSSSFQSATDEQKAMIAYTWQSVADQGQDITQLVQAFEVAAQQSDVYMKQQIRTFEDTLSMEFGYIIEDYGVGKEMILREMDYTTADLESYEKLMSRRATELGEDLDRYSSDLSIDQSKEMKYQLDTYKSNVETTRNNMASRGLFQSSIRGRAEQILADAHADITEDIETKYARREREMEISAERSLKDIGYQTEQKQVEATRQQQSLQDQMAQLKTTAGKQGVDILRKGEQYLGTDKMQTLLPQMGISVGQQDWMPADWMVGDIKATGLKAQQQQDILQRAGAFLGQ